MGRPTDLATYLTSLFLPEDGRWGVSFGLTLESHALTRSCHLVLGLGHQLGWDWEGGGDKGTGSQAFRRETEGTGERGKPKLGLSGSDTRYSSLVQAGSAFSSFLSSKSPVAHPSLPLGPFSLVLLFTQSSTFLPLIPASGSLRQALTVNSEGARCFRAAHAVLSHTGVGPLIVSTHTPDPKAVVTPDLIPAPLPTPRLGWPELQTPFLSPRTDITIGVHKDKVGLNRDPSNEMGNR